MFGRARVLRREPRQHVRQHRRVVDGAGAVDADPGAAVGLAHRVGHVFRAVAGVERHQHGADLGDGEDEKEPFGPVVHPERDVLALLHTERHQPLGDAVHLPVELAVGPARAAADQRLAGAPAPGRLRRQVPQPLFRVPLGHAPPRRPQLRNRSPAGS